MTSHFALSLFGRPMPYCSSAPNDTSVTWVFDGASVANPCNMSWSVENASTCPSSSLLKQFFCAISSVRIRPLFLKEASWASDQCR